MDDIRLTGTGRENIREVPTCWYRYRQKQNKQTKRKGGDEKDWGRMKDAVQKQAVYFLVIRGSSIKVEHILWVKEPSAVGRGVKR